MLMYKLGRRKHSPVRHAQPAHIQKIFFVHKYCTVSWPNPYDTVFTMFIKIIFASWVKADSHGILISTDFCLYTNVDFYLRKIVWEITYLLFYTYQHFTQGLWKCTQTSYPGFSRSAVIPQNCNTGLNAASLSVQLFWIVSLQLLSYLDRLPPTVVILELSHLLLCHFYKMVSIIQYIIEREMVLLIVPANLKNIQSLLRSIM